jgi:hypothetical protein
MAAGTPHAEGLIVAKTETVRKLEVKHNRICVPKLETPSVPGAVAETLALDSMQDVVVGGKP